jgi:hypothetical protein
LIADKYGYGLLLTNGGLILFVRPGLLSNAKYALTKLMLKGVITRFLRSLIVFLPAPYAENDRDHLLQKAKQKSTQPPV